MKNQRNHRGNFDEQNYEFQLHEFQILREINLKSHSFSSKNPIVRKKNKAENIINFQSLEYSFRSVTIVQN